MQTNIKRVELGKDLRLIVKKIKLEGTKLNAEQLQKLCNKLHTPATPYHEQSIQYVLVEKHSNFTKSEIAIDEWVVKLVDTSELMTLEYTNKEDRNSIAEIYKKSFIKQIERSNRFWKVDSPRIFYENNPFLMKEGIKIYRRFEVSEVDLGDNGLGFAVDISTAFFTENTIADYYEQGRSNELHRLLKRQKEQKGTLLYEGFNRFSKCYFANFDAKITLGNASGMTVEGVRFNSPFDYFTQKQPKFDVFEDDKAVLVSFKGLDHKAHVPAKKVRIRLMNDALSRDIGNLDKISPSDRKAYLESNFWNLFGKTPFEQYFNNIEKDFFIPKSEEQGIISMPNIYFKGNKNLFAPSVQSKDEYKKHYSSRKGFLERNKCFYTLGTNADGNFYIIAPENVNEKIIDAYEKAILEKIKLFTGLDLEPIRILYDTYLGGVYELKKYDDGFVLFLFSEGNDEPAAYYNIEQELGKDWNLKRATVKELEKSYRKWENKNFYIGDGSWNSYIDMTVYSIIQKMDCIPYVVEASRFNYDMQMVIDVSEGGSHFALSTQIWNKNMQKPLFSNRVFTKYGKKKETINLTILEDKVYELLAGKINDIRRFKVEKVLIVRDGKFCEEENIAIENAFSKIQKENTLSFTIAVDFVEYHKTTRKEIRIWNNYENVLEGSYFMINQETATLATTGAGTLNQGTSDPIILISRFSSNPNLKKIIEDIFLSAQFNFSNPRVAQRNTIAVTKADNLLQEKREQEVKRIK